MSMLNFSTSFSTVICSLSTPCMSMAILPFCMSMVLLPYVRGITHVMSYHQGTHALSFRKLPCKLRTFSAAEGSNAAVCSSRSRTFGSAITAMNNVRACLCPPERSLTFWVILSSRPIPSTASLSRKACLSAFVIPGCRPRGLFFAAAYCQVFFYGHIECRSFQRILKDSSHVPRPLVFRQFCYIISV